MVAVTLGRRVVDRERRESTRVDLGIPWASWRWPVSTWPPLVPAPPIGADSQRCGLSGCSSPTAVRPDS